MNEQNPYRLGLFLCTLFSVGVFLFSYGFSILDPHQTAWMAQGDPAQHYLGFNFFLQEPWHWPLGKISDFNWPDGTSLVYTDSMPLIAIPLKLFWSGASDLQFHGLWILFCFLLQGLAGYAFLFEACGDVVSASFGSVLISLFPSFLLRGFEPCRHYSCLAHFLIIAALLLAINAYRSDKISAVRSIHRAWYFILFLSLGVHFYFFFINFFIFGVSERKRLFQRRGLITLFSLGLATLLLMWAYGYFVIPFGSSFDGGFGNFSMNLWSWINPAGYTLTHLALPEVSDAQFEGYQYLGLGTLVLTCFTLARANLRQAMKAEIKDLLITPYALAIVFLFFFALSICLSIGTLRLPEWATLILYLPAFYWLSKKLTNRRVASATISVILILFYIFAGHLLRSSGRAGWYLSYLMIFWLFSFKPARGFVIAIAILQIADVAPLLMQIQKQNVALAKTNVKLNERIDALEKTETEFRNPALGISILGNSPATELPLSFFALKHHLKIGPVYLARGNLNKPVRTRLDGIRERIRAGNLSSDERVFTADFAILKDLKAPDRIHIQMIDDQVLWIRAAP